MEWRPIETAPRDGTSILVYVPGVNSWNRPLGIVDMAVAVWDDSISYMKGWISDIGDVNSGYDSTGAHWEVEYLSPTHWMPLPEPPEETE